MATVRAFALQLWLLLCVDLSRWCWQNHEKHLLLVGPVNPEGRRETARHGYQRRNSSGKAVSHARGASEAPTSRSKGSNPNGSVHTTDPQLGCSKNSANFVQCMERVDFALHPSAPQAFIDCLYKLRTRWRPREKSVHAGGIHYPTLITTHHTWPPVSTSGARLCWLDELGTRLRAETTTAVEL